MKALVFAYRLVVSGTTVNAIELSAALRDLHGFDVVLFAAPGPLLELAEESRLRFIAAPDAHFCPSPSRMRALRDAVRSERPDVLHVWDWPQCVDAYYAVHLPMRVPMIVTDMSMGLTRLLPKALPTTFGTPELADRASAAGYRRATLLVPPVDVKRNAMAAVDPGPFRACYGIEEGDVTLVTVSRLDDWMKGESLLRTLDVVRTLGRDLPLRFVIVGDGTAKARIQALADRVNSELRRSAVVLTGALVDPRPAYAAADIVVGMGGSALRGAAFGKPLIIVGEHGFSAALTPETAESFYYQGMYGLGNGGPSNAGLLADICELAQHPDRRQALGQLSRQFVLERFSLETVSARLAHLCRAAALEMPPLRDALIGGLTTAVGYLRERRFRMPSRPPAAEKDPPGPRPANRVVPATRESLPCIQSERLAHDSQPRTLA